MRKFKWRQKAAVALAVMMIFTGISGPDGVAAKGRMKLNKKKVTIRVGKKVKLKLKNAKKKVKWKSTAKKNASVNGKGVVKGKKKGTARIIAKCGGKKFICKVVVRKKKNTSVKPGEVQNTMTPLPDASAEPSQQPAASGAPTGKPATTTAYHQVPAGAQADTLAVGKINITLGMSKLQVEAAVGAGPDQTGVSPWGCESYIYNPSGDYTNYIEIQFKNDKVVEMSTISPYFCYAGIVSSKDSVTAIKAKGFVAMTEFSAYKAAYKYNQTNAHVMVFSDHQGDGGIYGIQVFDKTVQSNLKKLLMPSECNYDANVKSLAQIQMVDYTNAFRAYKGLSLMTRSKTGTAQACSEKMAAAGKWTVDSPSREYFEDNYGNCYLGNEFTGYNCADAFSTIVYMIDLPKDNSGTVSSIYKYLTADKASDLDSNGDSGETLDFNVECGFAYSTKKETYMTVDLYVLN